MRVYLPPVRAAVLAATIGLCASAPVAAHRSHTHGHNHAAVSANTRGMLRYHRGDLARAAEQFRDAIRLDPTYVNAHYNLACVASRLRDVTTAVRELRWLADDTNPEGNAKLDKSASDPDLDFISTLPAVRERLGLPPFDPTQPLQWLTERSGLWSVELVSEDCQRRSYTLRLTADQNASLRVREACAGKPPLDRTFLGKIVTDGGKLSVTVDWSLWPKDAVLTLEACSGLEAPGSCFILTSAGRQMGPFHRGQPGASPLPRAALSTIP
jgi:hypothetical protein